MPLGVCLGICQQVRVDGSIGRYRGVELDVGDFFIQDYGHVAGDLLSYLLDSL